MELQFDNLFGEASHVSHAPAIGQTASARRWRPALETPGSNCLCIRCAPEDVDQVYQPGKPLAEGHYYSMYRLGFGWFHAKKDPTNAMGNRDLSNMQHLPWIPVEE